MVVQVYAKHQDFGIGQGLVQQYYALVEESLQRASSKTHEEFDKLESDFQRVVYVMWLLEISSGKTLVQTIDPKHAKERLQLENDKSDYLSIVFLKHGIESMQMDDTYLALYDFTKAAFLAASKIQLALAIAHRADLLLRLGLIKEAKSDAKEALPNLELKADKAKTRIVLGKCYMHSNNVRKAKNQFKKVCKLLKHWEKPIEKELMESALLEIKKCEGDVKELETQPQFVCYRPKLPIIKDPEGNILFMHTMKPRLWSTVAARNIGAGEIVASVKPFANPLSANLTRYCFFCFKRCHNLIPCKHCTNVGFCSKECAKMARKNKMEGDCYPKQHKYDCNGMLPVIFNCLNRNKPSYFQSSLSHTVFNCIANTNPHRLLEYITATGKYKGGPSHAAFKGITEIRLTRPNLWLTSDYASASWLYPCTDGWKQAKGNYGSMLFDFTIASIFLTYCLYIGGYPMDWCSVRRTNQVMRLRDKTPASWIAACFLYHFQATAINSFRCTEFIFWQGLKRREYLSCGIYPPISIINHSCNPSVDCRFSTGGAAVLIANRSLRGGSEVTIAYNTTYIEADTQYRKQFLKENFFFECMCEACQDDWNDDNPQELTKCRVCHFESGLTITNCPMCRLGIRSRECLKVIADSHELIRKVKYVKWNDGMQKCFAFLIDKANSLLVSPSKTVTLLKQVLLHKLGEMMTMWTEEPWQSNFFTCMEPGKSLFSEEDRRHLLD